MFKRFKKKFILSIYTTKDYIVWRIHHDFITQEIFDDFVLHEIFLLCISIVYEKINFVFICDNVFAHKSMKLKKMCFEIDIKLTFLSLYSSNYNSIEIFFAILKKWMKKYDYVIVKLYKSLLENFERFLHDAMFAQSQRDIRANYFALRVMIMMIYKVIYKELIN